MSGQSLWVESSEHLDEFFKAHAKALGALRNAPRTCVSHFAKKDKQGNPIPDYADLATIFDTARKALSENGLSVTQSFMPYGTDGTMMLVTTLGHGSGQFQRSFLPMKGNVPPQQLASAATYLKRVALCALIGIAADDDDDGESANRTAAVAVVEDEARVEKMGVQKLRASKTAAERADVLAKAQQRVTEGTLSSGALDRLKAVAIEMDGKSARKEPVAVPA